MEVDMSTNGMAAMESLSQHEKPHDTLSTKTTPSTSDLETDVPVNSLGDTQQDNSNNEKAIKIPPPLTHALSTTTSHHTAPLPPPDGGALAWLQVLCAHFVVASCWGFTTSFGVFQTYYTSHLSLPQSTISWIGSCQTTLLFLVGIGSGRAMDAGHFRLVFISGAILQVVGVMTLSVSTSFWQLLLSQGVCFGIGAGLVFTPTMALLSTYFEARRSFVMGIAATGSCTGGLVFPVVARQLIPVLGFGWSVRIIGFIMLAFNSFAAAFLRQRLAPRRSGPLVEWKAFKEGPYTFLVVGMFLIFFSLYFAFYYVGTFSRDVIGLNYTDSINLLLVMVGVGVPGRLLPGLLADRMTGPVNAVIPMASLCAIMFFAWIGVKESASLYVFAAIYGIGSAGIQSLFPAALSSLTQDLNKAGTRLGMGFFVVSFAVLTGPPIGGALLATHGGWLAAQMWGGCSMACGICLLIAARIAKTGLRFKQRV